MKRLDVIQGPLDYNLSDSDPRLSHWRSQGQTLFANSSIQNSRRVVTKIKVQLIQLSKYF